MKTHSYEISIPAPSEAEANIKMKALTILASKLTAKELERLAYVVQNDPVKTAFAKRALGV